MDKEWKKSELIMRILENQEERALEDEEMMSLLLDKKVSRNTNEEHKGMQTYGGKMADRIAKFVGSWSFIILFISCLLCWIVLNAFMLSKAVDPYPFILLNLILSCVAAIQAPVIMMSQNRQEEKDRLQSYNDYKANLKSEIIIEDLYQKIDLLLAQQEEILKRANI
ncbi:MAG: DUF1003 domain-containing protein [Clostridiaceae bacterium]|nr:DUF1003 domain-containing protein [Clostridia bacterium]NLD47090.1 DUF1003 domain-containing protein [Clostridiaceae bacterium]